MFPTNRKITGYTFGQKTFYSDFHIGTDYAKENDPVYAPFNGNILKLHGAEGGNTIWFYPEGKKEMIRFLHLQKILKVGKVKEGEKMAVVGHTGLVRPPGIAGSHTHIDISKNGKLELNNKSNFQNPEDYNWGDNMNPTYIEQDGKIGIYFDFGQYSIIQWATDPIWGDQLSDHFKPEGTLKITK